MSWDSSEDDEERFAATAGAAGRRDTSNVLSKNVENPSAIDPANHSLHSFLSSLSSEDATNEKDTVQQGVDQTPSSHLLQQPLHEADENSGSSTYSSDTFDSSSADGNRASSKTATVAAPTLGETDGQPPVDVEGLLRTPLSPKEKNAGEGASVEDRDTASLTSSSSSSSSSNTRDDERKEIKEEKDDPLGAGHAGSSARGSTNRIEKDTSRSFDHGGEERRVPGVDPVKGKDSGADRRVECATETRSAARTGSSVESWIGNSTSPKVPPVRNDSLPSPFIPSSVEEKDGDEKRKVDAWLEVENEEKKEKKQVRACEFGGAFPLEDGNFIVSFASRSSVVPPLAADEVRHGLQVFIEKGGIQRRNVEEVLAQLFDVHSPHLLLPPLRTLFSTKESDDEEEQHPIRRLDVYFALQPVGKNVLVADAQHDALLRLRALEGKDEEESEEEEEGDSPVRSASELNATHLPSFTGLSPMNWVALLADLGKHISWEKVLALPIASTGSNARRTEEKRKASTPLARTEKKRSSKDGGDPAKGKASFSSFEEEQSSTLFPHDGNMTLKPEAGTEAKPPKVHEEKKSAEERPSPFHALSTPKEEEKGKTKKEKEKDLNAVLQSWNADSIFTNEAKKKENGCEALQREDNLDGLTSPAFASAFLVEAEGKDTDHGTPVPLTSRVDAENASKKSTNPTRKDSQHVEKGQHHTKNSLTAPPRLAEGTAAGRLSLVELMERHSEFLDSHIRLAEGGSGTPSPPPLPPSPTPDAFVVPPPLSTTAPLASKHRTSFQEEKAQPTATALPTRANGGISFPPPLAYSPTPLPAPTSSSESRARVLLASLFFRLGASQHPRLHPLPAPRSGVPVHEETEETVLGLTVGDFERGLDFFKKEKEGGVTSVRKDGKQENQNGTPTYVSPGAGAGSSSTLSPSLSPSGEDKASSSPNPSGSKKILPPVPFLCEVAQLIWEVGKLSTNTLSHPEVKEDGGSPGVPLDEIASRKGGHGAPKKSMAAADRLDASPVFPSGLREKVQEAWERNGSVPNTSSSVSPSLPHSYSSAAASVPTPTSSGSRGGGGGRPPISSIHGMRGEPYLDWYQFRTIVVDELSAVEKCLENMRTTQQRLQQQQNYAFHLRGGSHSNNNPTSTMDRTPSRTGGFQIPSRFRNPPKAVAPLEVPDAPPVVCLTLAAMAPLDMEHFCGGEMVQYLRSAEVLRKVLQKMLEERVKQIDPQEKESPLHGTATSGGVGHSSHSAASSRQASSKTPWNRPPSFSHVKPRYLQPLPPNEITLSIISRAKERKQLDEQRSLMLPVKQAQMYIRAAIEVKPTSRSALARCLDLALASDDDSNSSIDGGVRSGHLYERERDGKHKNGADPARRKKRKISLVERVRSNAKHQAEVSTRLSTPYFDLRWYQKLRHQADEDDPDTCHPSKSSDAEAMRPKRHTEREEADDLKHQKKKKKKSYLQTHAKDDEHISWSPPPPSSSSSGVPPEKNGPHHHHHHHLEEEEEGGGKSAQKRRASKDEHESKKPSVSSTYRSVSPYFKTDGTPQGTTKSGKRRASHPEGVTVFPIGSFDPGSRTSMMSYSSSPRVSTSSFSHSLTCSTPSRMHRSSSEEEKTVSEGEDEKQEKRRRKEREKKMEKAKRERERRKKNKRKMMVSSSDPSVEASQREHENHHHMTSVEWSTDEQWQKEKEKFIAECRGGRKEREDAWQPSSSSPDFSPYRPKHAQQRSPRTSARPSRRNERGSGVEAPREKEERRDAEEKVHGKECSVWTSTVAAAMAAITAVHRRTPSVPTSYTSASFRDATAWEREDKRRRRRRRWSNRRESEERWPTASSSHPHREEVSIHAPAVCYAPKRPPSAASRPPHAPGTSHAPHSKRHHHHHHPKASSMPPPRSMAAPLYPTTTSHDDSFERRQAKRRTGGAHGPSTRPPLHSKKSPKGWWVPPSSSSRHYKASSSSAAERAAFLSTVPDPPLAAATSGTVPLSPTEGGRPPRHHPQPPAPPPLPPHRRSRVSEDSSIDTGLSFDTVVGYTVESDGTEERSKAQEADDITLSSSSPTVGRTSNRARRLTSPPLGSARASTSGSAETAVPLSVPPTAAKKDEEGTKRTKKSKGGEGMKKVSSPTPSSSGSPPASRHGRGGGPTAATSHAAPIPTHPSATHAPPHPKKKKKEDAATVAHPSSQRISILSFTGSSDLELAIPTSEASEPPPPTSHPKKEKEKNALSPPEKEEAKKQNKTTTKKSAVVPRPPSGEKKTTTAESGAAKKKKVAAPPSKPAATKSSASKHPPPPLPPPPQKKSTKPPLSPHSSSSAKKPDHSESGGSGASSAEKLEEDMREALKRLSISSFHSSSLLHSVEKVDRSSPRKHATEKEKTTGNGASYSSLHLSGELSRSSLPHSKDTLAMAKQKTQKPAVTPLIPSMYESSSSYASLPSVSLSSGREEPDEPASASHRTLMTISRSTLDQHTFSSLMEVAAPQELLPSSAGSSSPKHPTQTTDLYSSDGTHQTVGEKTKKKKKGRSTSDVSAFSDVSADTEESTSLAVDPSETLVTEGGIGSKKPLLYHPHAPLRGKQVPSRPAGKGKPPAAVDGRPPPSPPHGEPTIRRHSSDSAEPSGGMGIPAAGGGAAAARVLELESGSKLLSSKEGRDSEPSMLGSLNTSLHYRRTSLLSSSTSPSPATPGELEGESSGVPIVSVEPHTRTAEVVRSVSSSSSSISSDTEEEEETNEAARMGAFLDGSLMLSPDKKGGDDGGKSAWQLSSSSSSSPLDGSVKVRPRTSSFVQTDEESKEVEASDRSALKTSGQYGEKRESHGGQEAPRRASVHSPSSGFTPHENGAIRPSASSHASSAGSTRTPVLLRRGSTMTNELQMGLPGVTRLGSGMNSRSRRLSQYSHGMTSVSGMGSGSGVLNGNGSVTESGRGMHPRNSISLSSNRSIFSASSQSGKAVRPMSSGSLSNGYDGMNAYGASKIRGRLSLSAARTSQTNGSPLHDSKSGLGSILPSNSGSHPSTGMADVWKDDVKETVGQTRQEQRPQEHFRSGMGLPGRPSISLNAPSPTTAGVSA